MVALIPESHQDLLERRVFVVATTLMPDGTPQSSVIWWDYDGDYIRMNTATGRQKEKNLLKNPKITLVAVDPDNGYRYIEIRGVVESVTPEGGREHIEKLSWKYENQKYYGGFNQWSKPEDETRLIVNIRPTRVRTG
jgi:PPOX class probable F420-dependent enzyme